MTLRELLRQVEDQAPRRCFGCTNKWIVYRQPQWGRPWCGSYVCWLRIVRDVWRQRKEGSA